MACAHKNEPTRIHKQPRLNVTPPSTPFGVAAFGRTIEGMRAFACWPIHLSVSSVSFIRQWVALGCWMLGRSNIIWRLNYQHIRKKAIGSFVEAINHSQQEFLLAACNFLVLSNDEAVHSSRTNGRRSTKVQSHAAETFINVTS